MDWLEIDKYNELTQKHILLCLSNLGDCRMAEQHGVRYFYGYPICTYYDFHSIIENFNSEYIILGAPLFFDLPYVLKFHKQIRAYPNVANMSPFPHKDNVCGTWIRPDDLNYYSRFIHCIEFENVETDQEQALYRIYMKEHKFVGPLGLLVQDLNYKESPCLNHLIVNSNFQSKRIACKQMCQNNSPCRICYHTLKLADRELLTPYAQMVDPETFADIEEIESEQT